MRERLEAALLHQGESPGDPLDPLRDRWSRPAWSTRVPALIKSRACRLLTRTSDRPTRPRRRSPPRCPTPPRRARKLYVETVGCQMNLLDSELVVAKLRNEGYVLTQDIEQADTILYNTCSVRQHAEDKIYSALGRIKGLKAAKPDLVDRRPRLHGPEGSGRDPQAGPARRHRRRPGPARAGLRPADEGQGRRQAADRREPAPDGRVARDRDGELRRVRPAPRARHAAEPASGVRPDHDGVRQVLHLLHRPLRPGPRAEPAARGDRRRGEVARRRGGQGDHPPRPDGQQLQIPRARRPDRPPLRPPRTARTRSTASGGSSSSRTSRTT